MAAENNVVEEPQAEKRNNKSNILFSYTQLLKDKPVIRNKHIAIILKYLERNSYDEQNITYALKRTVRALGASSNSSRAGFYTLLSALLRSPGSGLTVEGILDLVEKELRTSGQNSKSENADILTGQVLVCGAMLRSGTFNETSDENKKKIVETLIQGSKRKSYLSLPSYVFLVDSLQSMDEKNFKLVLKQMTEELKKPLNEYTLENLYFILEAREKFPKQFGEKYFNKTIEHKDVISISTVPIIAELLMFILPIKQLLKHPVYTIVCKKIAESPFLPQFLEKIDEIVSKPTITRHQAATLILTNLANNLVDLNHLPSLFTPCFINESITYFKTVNLKIDDDLQSAIHNFFNVVVAILSTDRADSKLKVAVIKRLLFPPGCFIFEKLTKSKIVQQITTTLDGSGVKELSKVYKRVMLAESKKGSEKWHNGDRLYAAQLIVKLMSHSAVKGEIEWKKEMLTAIMEAAYLKTERYSNVGTELAASLKETFFNALSIRLPKLDDVRSLLSHLVHHLDKNINQTNYTSVMRTSFNDEDLMLWNQSVDLINKLESSTKKSHLRPVFHSLFLHMSLSLHNNNELASDSLKELFSCYEKTKKKNKLNDTGTDDEVQWIEVVVDLFLNLLSHSSRILRNLIGCVFPHLCKDLTANAIHQILSVLDPKNEDNPLSKDSDDDDDGENDNESIDEEEDDDDNDEIMEDPNDEDETVSDKLRQAVSEALGGAQSDDESIDLDKMSDGEAEKLNSALGQAFKRFKPNTGKKSKKQSKDDKTLTHFRTRVIDLLVIYLDSPDLSMINCLEIMLPLLQTLEFCVKDIHQMPLKDRVRACLKKLVTIKKFGSIEGVDRKVLCNLLHSLLEKGTKTTLVVQEIGDKIADCSVFIVKCSQHLETQNLSAKKGQKLKNEVVKILNESLENFFVKRDNLTPFSLFRNLLDLFWDGVICLIPKIIKYIFDDQIRPYRRNQGLELLQTFYSNRRVLTANEEAFKPQLQKLETNLVENTKKYLSDPSTCKDKFIGSLFLVLNLMKQSTVKTEHDWSSLGVLIREFRSQVTLSKNTKLSYQKLCGTLKIEKAVKMNAKTINLNNPQKNDELNEENALVEKQKKKQQGKAAKKLKKQTQKLRMQSLSEGLTNSFSFADTDMDAIPEMENGVESSEEDASTQAQGKRKAESNSEPKKKKHKQK